MKKSKRILSCILAFAIVTACMSPLMLSVSGSYAGTFQFDENGKFTVMQITDVQCGSSVPSRVVTAITRGIQRFQPDLVVLTGDNIIETITSTGNFQAAVSTYLAPVINAGVKFAVTFGNHDDEGNGGDKTSQYNYYMSMGGGNFVDHDVDALDGVGSGVIPIYPNGQTSGTPAWQVYLMDSGSNPSSGSYDCCYTSQIDYYCQRSQQYPGVPSLWFQHIIIPSIYPECMSTSGSGPSFTGGGSYSGSSYYIRADRINYARSSSNNLYDLYNEDLGCGSTSLYESTAHRSSATYGSKTLYDAWVAYGNLKGAYFGHDHENEFTCTTDDGIDLGYGESTGLYKTLDIIPYNDDNPGVSIYELDDGGTYKNLYYAESDIAVTFNANGGTGYMTNQLFTKNSTKSLSANAFTRPGYTFAGWATSAGGGVAYANGASYTAGTSDVTLYAKWTLGYYNITFNANGGTGGTGPASMQATTALSAPAVSRMGYTLSGWSPAVPSTVPFADTTYTAQWSANTYTVEYYGNMSTGGSTANSGHIYDVAKPLTENGYTRIGYSFSGWNTDPNGSGDAYTDKQNVTNLTMIDDDILTFYAVWSINSYNITFNANGGTGGTGPTSMVYNSALTAPVVSRPGYNFYGWSPAVPTAVPAADTTYTAQWSVRVHSIVFDANGGTGGTGGTMAYGADLTPPSVTRTGYDFDQWLPSVPATVPDADAVYTARWTPLSYTVTFDANGGEGGTSESKVFDTALSSPSVFRVGYTFTGWSPEVPASVPASDSTYIAQWAKIDSSVIFDANGGNGGASATMDIGNPIIPPVMTRSGYLFTGWTPALPGFVTGGFNTYSAKWAVNSYQITFDANGGTGGTSGLMEYGSPLTKPAVTRAGFTFNGWSPAVPSTVPASNTTYTAQWTRNKIEITFDANGGEGGISSLMTFDDVLTPPVVTRAGYIFTGWDPAVPSTVVPGNRTYTAQWLAAD